MLFFYDTILVFVFTESQNIFNILIVLVTFFAMKLVSTALKKGDKKCEVNTSVR